jgi:hypothetical protein
MFLGPGICLFTGAGVQYLLGQLQHERRRQYYRFAALLLLFIAIAGATRDVVLRIREINASDLRSTLVASGRVLGTDGQFVVLTGETSPILTYYMNRYVAQPVLQLGKISPSQVRSGSNLGVVTTSTNLGGSDSDSFGGFERRFGMPMMLIWTQVAHIQPTNKEPGVVVRIYHVGETIR